MFKKYAVLAVLLVAISIGTMGCGEDLGARLLHLLVGFPQCQELFLSLDLSSRFVAAMEVEFGNAALLQAGPRLSHLFRGVNVNPGAQTPGMINTT